MSDSPASTQSPHTVIWTPSDCDLTQSQLAQFMTHINQKYTLQLRCYSDLYQWSITQSADFWAEIWQFCKVIYQSPYQEIVDDPTRLPGARWFTGATLNFAENCLRYRDGQTALRYKTETSDWADLSYSDLFFHVAAFAKQLRHAGVQKGDRVAAIMTHCPETIIAMLATASIGAIWSSCSPDFGESGILDRFSQIEPKILIAVTDYSYHGKSFEIVDKLKSVCAALPSLAHVYLVSSAQIPRSSELSLNVKHRFFNVSDPVDRSVDIVFEPVDFMHPLCILYSSGTTGTPKAIVHSTGGVLLQHLKEHQLHCDLRRSDIFFYFTTCGWMMWNWQISALATGATVVVYDGSPLYPDSLSCWQFVDTAHITVFGTSAKFISTCMEKEIDPRATLSLQSLRLVLSTGSPLVEDGFDYIYQHVKPDIQVSSISGGTDIVSCFALGCPIEPVYRGYLQCRGLGMAVQSIGENGESLIGEPGELVCSLAAPSMPIGFWNDPDNRRFLASYFEQRPGYWTHGDYVLIEPTGHLKLLGRSDTTLNPGGVRIGTSEIYRVVEAIDGIADSLVVGKKVGSDEHIVLFVVLKNTDFQLDNALKRCIMTALKTHCSPRHVPRRIHQVSEIPYTISGKKVELAVKKILDGQTISNLSSIRNPDCLASFYTLT